MPQVSRRNKHLNPRSKGPLTLLPLFFAQVHLPNPMYVLLLVGTRDIWRNLSSGGSGCPDYRRRKSSRKGLGSLTNKPVGRNSFPLQYLKKKNLISRWKHLWIFSVPSLVKSQPHIHIPREVNEEVILPTPYANPVANSLSQSVDPK